MAYNLSAEALRKLADALDRLNDATAATGATFCPYGRSDIEIDGVTLRLDREVDGDKTRYFIDISPQ